MSLTDFHDSIPRIQLRDPLAELLGAAPGGLLEYRYADAVKLAGHSCPTVAGAWLMSWHALRHLYVGEPPERGGIKVEMRGERTAGTNGVVANVIGLITGAAGEEGFKGLAGRHARRGLLVFNAPIEAPVRFSRTDTGASCEAEYHPEQVPAAPGMDRLFGAVMSPDASSEDRQAFAAAWQERLRRLLVDHFHDPALVVVRPAR